MSTDEALTEVARVSPKIAMLAVAIPLAAVIATVTTKMVCSESV